MWAIKIHHLVLKEDFKGIPAEHKARILKTIQKKLSLNPEGYGKPLQGEFFGYWRLRIEDYRVVYCVIKKEIVVLVIKIGMRKDDKIYKELILRLRRLG